LGQWQINIRALALALGDESKAEDAIAHYHQLIAAAREDLSAIVATNPKTLIIGANSLKTGEISAITAQSYLGELMEKIGFEMIAPPSSLNYAPLSLEILPDLNEAQYIFVLGYELGQHQNPKDLLANQTSGIQKEWSENPIAQSLTASQRDRVYFSTYFLWNGLNGPLGTELILEELRQFLLPG
jgi:iron complex transport system substrate-binding protein